MTERHSFVLDKPKKQLRRISAGIDLLHAGSGCGIRQSPAMGVKHRSNRHIDVFAMETSLVRGGSKADEIDQRMKDELTVAEIDACRRARRSCRVEHRRPSVLAN